MQISPISFGRAIKINAPLPVAKKLAEDANIANYGDFSSNPKTKSMQKFLDKIFNDTQVPNGKARVVELDGNVYIFSGKEAAEEERLTKEANAKIKANEEFVYWLPDRITRRQQQIKYENINQSILETTQTKKKRLVEDCENGKKNSTIDVHYQEIDDEKKGKRIKLIGLTYKTYSETSEEVRKLDFTKIQYFPT